MRRAALSALPLLALAAGCGSQEPPGPLACAGTAAPAFPATRLLVGVDVGGNLADAGANAIAAGPGLDLRSIYLSGGIPDGPGPCADCRSGCATGGTSCAGAACGWWGCWQDPTRPPGQYASGFVDWCERAGRLPVLTYYELLQSYRLQLPGLAEGTAEVTVAARDRAFMARYLADLRFLLQRVGPRAALVHVEPDFWGYAQHAARDAGLDAHALPAAVASANPEDCAGEEDSIAGLGRCLVAMVRKHAPNARVALHASPWASGFDLATNASASVDAAAEGRKVGAFLEACGGALADAVFADLADRDAGYSGRWLDPTDATLPDFEQVLAWGRGVSDRLGRPLVWWQIPVGNMALPNVPGGYRDNRLDYFFDHTERVAASGAVAMAFGAGAQGQTTPATDGGHLAERAAALERRGGQPLCAP